LNAAFAMAILDLISQVLVLYLCRRHVRFE
jgi:hypothetical protein